MDGGRCRVYRDKWGGMGRRCEGEGSFERKTILAMKLGGRGAFRGGGAIWGRMEDR